MSGLLKIAGELYDKYEELTDKVNRMSLNGAPRRSLFKVYEQQDAVSDKIRQKVGLPDTYDHYDATRKLNNTNIHISNAHSANKKAFKEGVMIGGGTGTLIAAAMRKASPKAQMMAIGGSALGGALINKVYQMHSIKKHTATKAELEGLAERFKSA